MSDTGCRASSRIPWFTYSAYPSREAATKAWDGFRKDEGWITARTASEANGPIVAKVVSVFMDPTNFSGLK